MASKQSTIDFILKQIAGAGAVRAKKMFGEYGIYCDEKIVALVCDDQLFVKPTTAGKEYIGNFIEGHPYPGAKPHLLISDIRGRIRGRYPGSRLAFCLFPCVVNWDSGK